MAGGSTRVLSLTIPGIAAIVSGYWLFKKNQVWLARENQGAEGNKNSAIFMSLKESDDIVAHQKVDVEEGLVNSAGTMQLKEQVEQTETATVGEASSLQLKAKVKCLNSSSSPKSCENGDICQHSDDIKKNTTNGTSAASCDNNDDSISSCASTTNTSADMGLENDVCSNGTSDINKELTNGIKSIDIEDSPPPGCEDQNCTNVPDISPHTTDSSMNEDNCMSVKDTNSELPSFDENLTVDSELLGKLPSIIPEKLTCDTSYEPEASTSPDSGLSAELHESDAASSLSDPASDCAVNGDSLNGTIDCVISDNSKKFCCNAEQNAHSPGLFDDLPCVHEFEIPSDLCGHLIGTKGRFVKFLKKETNVDIRIKDHLLFTNIKICTVTGTEDKILDSLELIREKFPLEKYPTLTLDGISPLQNECTLPVTLTLSLPEGVNFDAVLSSTVTAGQFFLQQPTHPTHHSLLYLTQSMTQWYSTMDAPKLCRISNGNIVAAPMAGGWYRVEVVSVDLENEECYVKFLDFGGYSPMPISELRQLKIDFSYVPFQAVECFLGTVTYPEGESSWSEQAKAVFEELAQGQILQGYIVGYDENRVPFVHLYRVQGTSEIFINRELVNQGLARWIEQV